MKYDIKSSLDEKNSVDVPRKVIFEDWVVYSFSYANFIVGRMTSIILIREPC